MENFITFLLTDYFSGVIYAISAAVALALAIYAVYKFRPSVMRFIGTVKHNARIRRRKLERNRIRRLRAKKARCEKQLAKYIPPKKEIAEPAPAAERPKPLDPSTRSGVPIEVSLNNIKLLLGGGNE